MNNDADAGLAIEPLVRLPVYVSKATPDEAVARDEWREAQEALIDEQVVDAVPAEHIKVRCGCGALVCWRSAVRCLYCRVWFCPACGQEHFGFRLPDQAA